MGHEAIRHYSPEAASPYADFTHDQLIDRFYASEGSDLTIGRALSSRLFRHAGLNIDAETTPLIGRDGAQIQQDGRSLVLADYVNYAVDHHFEALEGILGFFSTQPGEREYEITRAAIAGRLNPDGR